MKVPNVKEIPTSEGEAMLRAYNRIRNVKAAIMAGLHTRLTIDAVFAELIGNTICFRKDVRTRSSF